MPAQTPLPGLDPTDLGSHQPSRRSPRRRPLAAIDIPRLTRPTDHAAALSAVLQLLATSSPAALSTTTIKVPLPQPCLTQLHTWSQTTPHTSDAGRPATAPLIGNLIEHILITSTPTDLLDVLTGTPPTADGLIRADLPTPVVHALTSLARQIKTTTPILIGCLLTDHLTNPSPTKAALPVRRLAPTLLETLQDAPPDTTVTIHIEVPTSTLTQATPTRTTNQTQSIALGSLLTAGLSRANANPSETRRRLLDPQMSIPPTTRRVRVRVPETTWRTIRAIALLADQPADTTAALLLSLALEHQLVASSPTAHTVPDMTG